MAATVWGVYVTRARGDIRFSGYVKDEQGLPRRFPNRRAAERYATRARQQLVRADTGYLTWEARPMEEFVLRYLKEQLRQWRQDCPPAPDVRLDG